jgi:hypothetical protein
MKSSERRRVFPSLLVNKGHKHMGPSRRETQGKIQEPSLQSRAVVTRYIKHYYKIIKIKQQDSTIFSLLSRQSLCYPLSSVM